MNPLPRLQTVEIARATGGTVSVPAATAEQAEAFTPPAGLRWEVLDLIDPKTGATRLVHVLAQA